MSLEIGVRAAVRWAGVLVVLAGTSYLVWQSSSQLLHRAPQQQPRNVAVTQAVVRFGDVDMDQMLGRITSSGGVDEAALLEVEKRGNPKLTAAAEFVAARFEHEHNHEEKALQYIQRALEAAPENAGLHAWCASVMLNVGQIPEAVAQSERAAELQPESADVQRIRGEAHYHAGRRDDAIAAWERSLQLAANQNVQESLDRAKREAAVEEHFTEISRGHFVLRYEDGKPTEALTDDLLLALEHDYADLSNELGVAPKTSITVVLYSARQFHDVTQAPAWVGAINDGRMRIPIGEVSSVTPELEAVLKHELTHSFVHSALPNCPTWLNEGLAQLEEPKNLEALSATISPQVRGGLWVPLSQLEGSFQKMSHDEAQRAYLESLAAAEYLRSAYGGEGVRRLLLRLVEGDKPETALHALTSGGYDDLDREAAAYLAKRSHAE